MNKSDPQFITCAMEAIEQGIKAEEIQEECACRMGFMATESVEKNQ